MNRDHICTRVISGYEITVKKNLKIIESYWFEAFSVGWTPEIFSRKHWVRTKLRNSPNPPLAYIVSFSLLRIAVSLTVSKTHILRRSFHIFIRNVSFLSLTNMWSHNLPPLGTQRLCCTLPGVWLYTICNSSSPPKLSALTRYVLSTKFMKFFLGSTK